jgi:hypothetical protein
MPDHSQLIPGSYMTAGDTGYLDGEFFDRFIPVRLAAAENPRGLLARNDRLMEFLASPVQIDALPVYSFFPPALAGGSRKVRVVKATKSGGRTFLLDPESAESLGLPPVLRLDLKKLGWGSGHLELRPEIKGGGCFLEHSAIDIGALQEVLENHPGLRRTFERWTLPRAGETILSSLATIEGRNAGGQEPSFGIHAVRSSAAMLGATSVKFAPALECVAHGRSYAKSLRIVSTAVRTDTELYAKQTASEIRYTAGSVRAVYFETAGSDERLLELCDRVSNDAGELFEALDSMLEDPRRYLELLATSTRIQPGGGYCWTKVGDISLTFRRDTAGRAGLAREYRNVQRRAWYLAKDEVIVRRAGKLFIDMESFRSWPSAYHAPSAEELWFQHELFVLNVLRDHVRVCVQFLVAIELKLEGRCDHRRRRELQALVLRRILGSVERSPWVCLDVGRNTVEAVIRYPDLGSARRYRFIRAQIGERYV